VVIPVVSYVHLNKERCGLADWIFKNVYWVNLKVKFTLQQDMKVQRWSRGIALLFL
jgi:hypothetical protein